MATLFQRRTTKDSKEDIRGITCGKDRYVAYIPHCRFLSPPQQRTGGKEKGASNEEPAFRYLVVGVGTSFPAYLHCYPSLESSQRKTGLFRYRKRTRFNPFRKKQNSPGNSIERNLWLCAYVNTREEGILSTQDNIRMMIRISLRTNLLGLKDYIGSRICSLLHGKQTS